MPPPRRKRRWLRFLGRHLPGVSLVLMVALLIITVLWPYVVITVPSGRVGVLWRRFYGFDMYCLCFVGRGTALDPREIREEGLHDPALGRTVPLLAGDRICGMTRFEASVLPWFGLPRSLPSR